MSNTPATESVPAECLGMKVTLTTSGGFAATVRRPPRVLDTNDLSDEEATRLRELLNAVPRGVSPAPGKIRDGMVYRIEVETPEGIEEVSAGDGAMSPAFASLLEFVREQIARRGT